MKQIGKKFKLAVANEWTLYAIWEGSNKWTTHIRKPFIEVPLFKLDVRKGIPIPHHYDFKLHCVVEDDMFGFYSIFKEVQLCCTKGKGKWIN